MKNLSEETKTKLVYSGELIIIALIFLVLGILKIVDVMKYNEQRRLIFNYITLVGGAWVITDFTWMLLSQKRRAKNCLLDKILNLPLGIYLLIFDIKCLIDKNLPTSFYVFGISIAFFYVFLNYLFQGIYHFFKPIPLLLDALEEDKQDNKEDENKKME